MLSLAFQSLLAMTLFLFLEWLFMVTKPSFFSALSWLERLRVLFAALGVLLVPVLGLFILLVLAVEAGSLATLALDRCPDSVGHPILNCSPAGRQLYLHSLQRRGEDCRSTLE